MASLRNLKKQVNYMFDDLIGEVFTYKHFHSDFSAEREHNILTKIEENRRSLLVRIGNLRHSEKKFAPSLQEIIKEVNESDKILDDLVAKK